MNLPVKMQLPHLPSTSSEFNFSKSLDHLFKANMARFTLGITPAGVASLWGEWFLHLAMSPGKQLQLYEKFYRKTTRWLFNANQKMLGINADCCIEPLPHDKRFASIEWQIWPYNIIFQAFLLQQQWWFNATTEIEGLSPKQEQVLFFIVKQILDRFSPSNFPWSNPEITKATFEQGGLNLVRGWINFLEDAERQLQGTKPVGVDQFTVGKNIAVTPGKIVYRNRLIELIQYSPATEKVYPEPILIIPAWIMKYYILDLSPNNSLVKYLVSQGHTVFMVSWRNPSSQDRELCMDDYRQMGVMNAIDTVSMICAGKKIHGMGYCLGGTLLTIAASAMARDGDDRLASLVTLATQIDFSEAGELMQFITESEVDYLESMMWEQGYLDGVQMAGAFQLLRSNDLIWSRIVKSYFLGERLPMNDLMAWNADLTRMPYRMHSEYLRDIFLHNDLAVGRYKVGGRPVTLADLRVPIFAVGTTEDHVAPWKSVYKITVHPAIDVTFLLTNGGHNAGIISELGHPNRKYQIATDRAGATYIDPDTWRENTPVQRGSWWPELHNWLKSHSGDRQNPLSISDNNQNFEPIMDAPGTYVLQS